MKKVIIFFLNDILNSGSTQFFQKKHGKRQKKNPVKWSNLAFFPGSVNLYIFPCCNLKILQCLAGDKDL